MAVKSGFEAEPKGHSTPWKRPSKNLDKYNYVHTRKATIYDSDRKESVRLRALNSSRWHSGRVNNLYMLSTGSLAQQLVLF